MSGVLLVTGASRGIGAATALAGAARGYAVCVNYRSSAERAKALVERVRGGGGRAIAVAADMALEDEVVELFASVDRELGSLTALVNNAGIIGGRCRLDEVTGAQLAELYAVNVIGPVLCAREAVRRMSTRHGGAGGAIVNVSSVSSWYGSPGAYVHYAASKGAVDSLTIGLAKEVAAEGVRVNAVRPGLVDTEIHASIGMPDRIREQGPKRAMGRAGTPDEIAAGILWLLSAEASYVTGALVDMPGAL